MLLSQFAANSGFTVLLPGHATEDVCVHCNDIVLKVVSVMCVFIPPPQHMPPEYKNYICYIRLC